MVGSSHKALSRNNREPIRKMAVLVEDKATYYTRSIISVL